MTAKTETLYRLTFEVETTKPLPVGEQIFVTGNQEALGNWKPDGLPLSRVEDTKWAASVRLPSGTKVEYKITRGEWAREALGKGGALPGNYTVTVTDDTVESREVTYWHDHFPEAPPKIAGDFEIIDTVHSEFLRFDRRVIVWLPPSYNRTKKKSYPVLYMHDGQQVFDPQTSTWNQDWEVDEWCMKLMQGKKMDEVIVVAVYCTEDRMPEYDPAQIGADYARFMIEELKPMIDEKYRTKTGPEHTAVAGASMGGTISFYLAWTRPDIYSMAACLSPAFQFADNEMDLDLVRQSEEQPGIKLFLYCGEGDKLERKLMPGMREMAKLLRGKGFKDYDNLYVVEDTRGAHNEAAWKEHTDEWLLFFFGRSFSVSSVEG
jgi:predicted alpha/beta superfamily hydrolase